MALALGPSDLFYPTVDLRAAGVGVRLRGQWYNFADKTWDATFDPAKHVQPCTPDGTLPAIQETVIPAAALPSGAYVVEFVQNAGAWTPVSGLSVPSVYTGLYPGNGLVIR